LSSAHQWARLHLRSDDDSSTLQPCNFQTDVYVAANNSFTDSRDSAIIVKTPRIVPKGMKRHSIQAITSAKVQCLRRERHRPAIKIQIAIANPSKNKSKPSTT